MTDWTSISNAIHAFAEGETGIDFAWQEQNVPVLTKPFGTLNRRALAGVGQDEITYDQNLLSTGTEKKPQVRGTRSFTVNFEVHTATAAPGSSASDILQKVLIGLKKPSTLTAFSAVNLAIVGKAEIRDLSTQADGRRENRAVLDVFFSTTDQTADAAGDTGYIETTEITGTLEEPGGGSLTYGPAVLPE